MQGHVPARGCGFGGIRGRGLKGCGFPRGGVVLAAGVLPLLNLLSQQNRKMFDSSDMMTFNPKCGSAMQRECDHRVKPLVKDTLKEDNLSTKDKLKVLMYTHSNRKSPLKEDNLSTKDKTARSQRCPY